jgi:hypothetical protein
VPLGSTVQSARFNPVQVNVGPTVVAPASFKWKNVGFDLLIENPEDFNRGRFEALVQAFENSIQSAKNATLVKKLKEWAIDPAHIRFSKYICFRLLRWVNTTSWQYAVPHAEAIWIYLFGTPVPTWYHWDNNQKKYQFDPQAWNIWFDSLKNSLRAVEAIYKEHNHESARGWPPKDQCQCQDCQNYRRAHPSTSSL